MAQQYRRVIKKDFQEELQRAGKWFADPRNSSMGYFKATMPNGIDFVVERKHFGYNAERPEFPDCCYVGGLEQVKVFEAIAQERKRQEDKWGEQKPQSLPGYLMILESELEEAKLGWIKNLDGKSAPLNEIVQLAAVAIACLERYGVEGSAISTDDIPSGPQE